MTFLQTEIETCLTCADSLAQKIQKMEERAQLQKLTSNLSSTHESLKDLINKAKGLYENQGQ